jgi:cob(I)alamin adenosyltransferase
MKKGFVQIYTGDGKGKTTAAIGLALRAHSRGFSVVILQFLKHQASGEISYIEESIPQITVKRFHSQSTFVWQMNDAERAQLNDETRNGFVEAQKIAESGSCDLLILDELLGACRNGFVSVDEILSLIKRKEESIELVLTGRDAPVELIAAADLVTEMKKIKHYFDDAVPAREGIEQ